MLRLVIVVDAVLPEKLEGEFSPSPIFLSPSPSPFLSRPLFSHLSLSSSPSPFILFKNTEKDHMGTIRAKLFDVGIL